MTQLLRRYEQELPTGIFSDLKNRAPLFWKEGVNVIFTDRGVQPLAGHALAFANQENLPVRGMISNDLSDTYKFFYGTAAALYGWNTSATVTDLSKTGGYSGDDLWSMTTFGAWTLAAKQGEQIQIRKTGGFDDLSGPSFSWAKLIVTRTPFLFAINTSDGGEIVQWCNADNPEDWTISASGSAGQLPIRDLDSEFRAAVKLRGEVLLFTDSKVVDIPFVGAPNYFGSDVLSLPIGALGKHSVVVVGSRVFGVGPRGFWWTDGSAHDYIDTMTVKRKFNSELNWAQRRKVVAWHNVYERSVVFYYPRGNSVENNCGLLFNYEDGTWSEVSYGRTAADAAEVFENGLTGDASGNVFLQDIGVGALSSGLGKIALGDKVGLVAGFGDLGFGDLGFGGVYGEL